jgi:hypothetical protein
MTTLKLIPYLSAIMGSWGGWAIGRQVGLFTAYLLCLVGLAGGLYVGRRLVKRVLGEA